MTVFTSAFVAARGESRLRRRSLVELAATALGRATRRVTRTAVMTVAGFGMLDVAAFEWSRIAGFTVAGISLLLLEYLTGKE
jgi:hypothetical protein